MSAVETKLELFRCSEKPQLTCYRIEYVLHADSRESMRDQHSIIVVSDDKSAVVAYAELRKIAFKN